LQGVEGDPKSHRRHEAEDEFPTLALFRHPVGRPRFEGDFFLELDIEVFGKQCLNPQALEKLLLQLRQRAPLFFQNVLNMGFARTDRVVLTNNPSSAAAGYFCRSTASNPGRTNCKGNTSPTFLVC
jgi:hypothetical protein